MTDQQEEPQASVAEAVFTITLVIIIGLCLVAILAAAMFPAIVNHFLNG